MRILIQVHVLRLKIVNYDLLYWFFFLCFVWFRIPISHQTGNLSHLVSGIVSLLLGFSTSYDLCFSFVFVSLASHFIYFKKCWKQTSVFKSEMPFFILYEQSCPDNQNRRKLSVHLCFYNAVLFEFIAVWAASYLHNSRREIKPCSCVSYNMKQSTMSK